MIDALGSCIAAETRQNCHGMRKIREDVVRYEQILTVDPPDLIVETGTEYGSSAAWFSQFAAVITIDSEDGSRRKVEPKQHPVSWWSGRSSTDPAVIADVYAAAAGKRVMVSLDSDHAPGHVLLEMQAYGPLVQPGDYMVVEDGIIRQWLSSMGPLDAIEAYLREHGDRWRIDHELEDMFPVTLFPSGWLRRIA